MAFEDGVETGRHDRQPVCVGRRAVVPDPVAGSVVGAGEIGEQCLQCRAAYGQEVAAVAVEQASGVEHLDRIALGRAAQRQVGDVERIAEGVVGEVHYI